ncbi:MAG: type II toxin-antitoxin system VapC family toxin [Limisphaerales bacterium]
MALLLDTCALVFFGENTGDLSPAAVEAIRDPQEEIFVSALSVAELPCAQERGRVKLRTHWKRWWNEILDLNG